MLKEIPPPQGVTSLKEKQSKSGVILGKDTKRQPLKKIGANFLDKDVNNPNYPSFIKKDQKMDNQKHAINHGSIENLSDIDDQESYMNEPKATQAKETYLKMQNKSVKRVDNQILEPIVEVEKKVSLATLKKQHRDTSGPRPVKNNFKGAAITTV